MEKKKRNRLIIAGVLFIAGITTVLFMTKSRKESSVVPSGGDTNQLSEVKEPPNPEAGNTDNVNDTNKPESGTNQENNKPEEDTENVSVTLTEDDISYLEKMTTVIPEFWETKDRNEEFWANLIFDLYYRDSDGETVDRYRFSEELGTTATYRKVSLEEVDALSEELFGDKMTDSVMPPEIPMNSAADIVYEDGNFYIGMESDGVAYDSQFVDMSELNGKYIATFSLKHVDSDWEGTVTLSLAPAKNKRGFIITGKELTPVTKASEEILDQQVYKVNMNPLGEVTFVAYRPAGTKEDVRFGLLKDEQEIYYFSVYDEEFYTGDLEFKEIVEVSFSDYNSDGYTDIVVIADYYRNDSVVSLVRMFSGTEGGTFIWEKYLVEAYNNTHDIKSAEDVISFVGKQENQMLFKGTSVIGCWEITEVAGTSKIYALSEEEMNQYLHAYLEYDRYVYNFSITGQEPLTGTLEGFKKESLTKEEFQSLYDINKELNGPETENYDSYEVIGKTGDSVFGDTVILLDQDNAYIYYEGVFFLAIRR